MTVRTVILSIETATRRGSVSVLRGSEVLASVVGDEQTSHSHTLLRDIDNVLKKSGLLLSDLGLLVVAIGPGSFTGLRIGLATIKALSATLRLPCIGIPTLQAVARAGGESKASVALLPAGRGELFSQMLSVLADGTVVELDKPAHLSPLELRERYGDRSRILWCGEGAHLHRDEIKNWTSQKGIDFSETQSDPRYESRNGWYLAPHDPDLARQVAGLALTQFASGHAGDAGSLRALYVRPSDAELKSNVDNRASSG